MIVFHKKRTYSVPILKCTFQIANSEVQISSKIDILLNLTVSEIVTPEKLADIKIESLARKNFTF